MPRVTWKKVHSYTYDRACTNDSATPMHEVIDICDTTLAVGKDANVVDETIFVVEYDYGFVAKTKNRVRTARNTKSDAYKYFGAACWEDGRTYLKCNGTFKFCSGLETRAGNCVIENKISVKNQAKAVKEEPSKGAV